LIGSGGKSLFVVLFALSYNKLFYLSLFANFNLEWHSQGYQQAIALPHGRQGSEIRLCCHWDAHGGRIQKDHVVRSSVLQDFQKHKHHEVMKMKKQMKCHRRVWKFPL